MQVQYRGGRHPDPSTDLSAMLVPLSHYHHQRHTLSAYTANSNADQATTPAHALNQRVQQHRNQAANRQQNQNKSSAAADNKVMSPLAKLQAEQRALRQRKANIARFGSTWLRPAGVPKTYQAMMDEAAEREEQELQARREFAAAEEQRAAREQAAGAATPARTPRNPTTLANQGRRGAMVPGVITGTNPGLFADVSVLDGGEDMEVDLDGDVPDADEVEYYDEEDDEDDDDDDDDEEEDEDEEGAQERDLDESIPDAGSYEHTDTDAEDDDSVSESVSISISENMARNPNTDGGVPPENALNPPRILDGATGRFVHSIEGTSEFMPVESPETSMLGRSPSEARERELQRRDEYLARRSMQ